ncbi:MAG: maleylpyruvate isomerase family mycothiol-dependent enzyme [Actinomycetes bacterium]
MTWDKDLAIGGYVEALTAMRDLAAELRDDEWPLPTDLPGWSVQDNVAHVAAVEDELAGRPLPEHLPDYSVLSHVTNPFAEHMEIGVDARRGVRPADLVDELRALVAERVGQLSEVGDDPEALVPGPMGTQRPVGRALGIRAFDVWAHEQDVRRATGRPERLSGLASLAALERIVSALPIVVSKEAGLPAGSVVRFEIEGPGPFETSLTVDVVVDAEGLGRVVANDQPGTATPGVTLALDFATLAHLSCGRCRPDQCVVTVTGDPDQAACVLDALAITP